MEKKSVHPGFFQAVYKGNKGFWAFIGVFLLVFIGYIVGQLPLTFVMLLKSLSGRGDETIDFDQLQQTGDLSLLGLDLNLSLFLLLLSFAGALGGLIVGVQWLHKRPWKTLVNFEGKLAWSKITFGFGFWLLLGFGLEGFSLIADWENYEFTFSLLPFLILLVISLTLLPIQTSFEELFFRGWLMQKLAYYLNSKVIALIFSTICFAGIHIMNPEVFTYGLVPMMIYYIQAGLLLGLITVLDDSLDLALGVHFATNFFAAVFFNYEAGALQTYSLFKNTAPVDVATVNVGFFFISILFIFVCYKRYDWRLSSIFDPIVALDDNRMDDGNIGQTEN